MKKLMIMGSALAAANIACAAGFGIYEASARGNAMGGALVGNPGDATANYYNPASMTDATNVQVAVGVTMIHPFCDVNVDHRSAGRMDPGWFTVPTFYFTIPLPGDFAIGWGNYTEFGLGSHYDRHWGLAGDTQETTMEQITLNPNLAYKICDWWSVSLGPRVSWISFENYKQPYNDYYPLADLTSRLKGDNWNAGWTASMNFKLHETVRLGITYRSEIRHKITGDFKIRGRQGADPVIYKSAASAVLFLPQSLSAGLNWDITPDWRAGFVATWTNWSSLDQIDFNLHGPYSNKQKFKWRDAFRFGIGTEYDVTKWAQVRLGYTFDQDPSSKAHASTMIPAGDRHIFGCGVGFNLVDNLWLDISYDYIMMNNEGYYIAGHYLENHSGSSHLIGATLRYAF